MSVTDVTDSTFEEEVVKSKLPVVIDIWAEWCGPCRLFSPIFDELSSDYDGKVKFVKIDADSNEAITKKYNIMSIPTTLLIEKGELKAMNVGAIPKEALKKWIDKNI
ncbi:MAG: thioredoxin [Candidatus Marsarchaeota archaeon]|jgi:thioredoxin 1|nr:thioredoxin [Candidatus Marsarchaeota archaeon]MCL5111582.1 thioredoxin [Candidatus Marsarchaeota archaeon]